MAEIIDIEEIRKMYVEKHGISYVIEDETIDPSINELKPMSVTDFLIHLLGRDDT